MQEENNIIKILPYIYVTEKYDIEILNYSNIKNIISINNNIENEEHNLLNIYFDENEMLIKSDNIINIDFESANNFIYNSLIKREKVIIYSKNLQLAGILIVGFILKNLKMTSIDTIYIVYRLLRIDINSITLRCIHTLFEYYKKLSK